ncbi:MAG: carnitine dehydratase [SAR86 cluster bacterium]|uniref:Carnitine dehydratase n=1 Tax=SAR86 cluster bacterium TaxID=2030880 RepID=A0A2A5B081_9GAMM|nr:MAG: carnitine dehydratase [SAR86 cluster bacterium]
MKSSGALKGKLIIDLSRVLGGPYCTQIMGDHGAEIVKIEPPRGDETRDWGPPFHEEDSAYFLGVNRNKRSMGLDLSKPEGKDVLLRLLSKADVLLENYKPGTMEKWGLGYEEVLKDKFPQLIHCRVSGFGSDGPWGGFPGYDAIIQAMAGWFSVNGEAGSNPTRLGLAMVDMGTGLYSAVAILMAITERERSGLGQYLDMTLYDCAVSLMHPHIANYNLSGEVPVATGNAHPNISPYDTYRTKTVDIFIGAGNNRAYAKLCTEIGREELIEDARFINNIDRVTNRDELKAEIESSLMKIDGAEIANRLAVAGLAAGPIHDTSQVVDHPHTLHREMTIEDGWYKMPGTPIKLSRTPGSMRHKPPKYGEHTHELLTEFGFDDHEIQQLLDSKTVLNKRQK